MGESNALVCAANGCSNPVRRSGDHVNEPMVWLIQLKSGLQVRFGLCDQHPPVEVGERGVVVGIMW